MLNYDDEQEGWPAWLIVGVTLIVITFWAGVIYFLTQLTCHF